MKKTIPLVIAMFIGVLWFGEFFMASSFYENWKAFFVSGSYITSAVAILVMVYSVVMVNYQKIRYSRERWYNVVQVLMIISMLLLYVYGGTATGTPFDALFMYVFVPLDSTVFALLAFYIASASFRAFRAKNLESSLLLVAAVIVMMGKIPLGEMISEHIPSASEWILDGPTSAGRRAINFGAYLGALTMMIRIFFGLEKSHLSD